MSKPKILNRIRFRFDMWTVAQPMGARAPSETLGILLSQIAWIPSVKYRRCSGRRVGYSSGVPITQRQLLAWSMCS